MIPFSQLRTGRLIVDLKEIPIADSMRVAAIPADSAEHATTMFLKAVIKSSTVDVRQMTVAERTYITVFYLGHTSPEGFDFTVSRDYETTLNDYICYEGDETVLEYKPEPDMSMTVAGETWRIRHLTGKYAETIERLDGHFDVPRVLHWQAGIMAAQLRNESDPDEISDENLDDWMADRIKILLSYSDSDFHSMFDFVEKAQQEMRHLMDVSASLAQSGLVCYANEKEGGSGLPPATFPALSCISERTKAIYRLSGESNG